MRHIYVFGSVCRGEVDLDSDVDMLALVDTHDSRIPPDVYSIYSYSRIAELWREGNPFAWHLHSESSLAYSSDGADPLADFGPPRPYLRYAEDCTKFMEIFDISSDRLIRQTPSAVFELSTCFLAIRNLATCYALGVLNRCLFSRNAALLLDERSLMISLQSYELMRRARILCTRGRGPAIRHDEVEDLLPNLHLVSMWMNELVTEAACHGK